MALKSMPWSLRPKRTHSRLTAGAWQCGIAMFWTIPVDPSVSRRLSILTSVWSALSSSLRRPTSSFRTSSFVVLSSCSLIASSAKNSRRRTCGHSLGTAAKPNDWLLLAQRVITLSPMHFPYPLAHEFPLFLAPMAAAPECPVRLLARRFGADVLVSELISASGGARVLHRLFPDNRLQPAERP